MNAAKDPAEKPVTHVGWGFYKVLLVALLFVADFGISAILTGGIEQSITFSAGRQIATLILAIGGMTP